jgi:hypothetical protein
LGSATPTRRSGGWQLEGFGELYVAEVAVKVADALA